MTMTGLLDCELAGVHDPRGRADSAVVRRALPGQTLVESGPLSFACSAPSWAGDVCAGVVGRVQYEDALREELHLRPEDPIEKALAAGYSRWGSRLLDHLHGPFALVVWSRHGRRGLLAQDQLGGRSLFTFIDGQRLLFATEVTVLLAMLPRRPDPDEIALVHHLVDHGVPDGRTLFRGLGRLGGGCHLELSSSGHVEQRHWAPRYHPPLREPPVDLAARLREELTAAVGDAVATDPTGAMLLSGGLDSSVVAGVAAPRARGLKAISAAFPAEPDLDETSWARRVADYTGMALTTVRVERRDPFRAAEDYLRAWQLPLPVPGLIIEEPLIATAHRLRAKVVFDGQGGDELFGATPYLVADRLLQLRPRAAWRLARRHPWLGRSPPLRHVWQVFLGGGLRGAVPPGLHTRVRRWREPGRYAPAWLRPAHARQYRDTHDPWRWKRLDGPRWWASLADTLTRGRETADIADYLRRRARMGGLEARSPLLDLRLVQLALRIPPETSFDPVTSRPLVREALRGALPPEVLARKDKRDFAAMQHETLQRTDNLEWARRLLDERSAAVGAYVDLRRLRRDHLDRPPAVGERGWRAWAVNVWNVATAELWLRGVQSDVHDACHRQPPRLEFGGHDS
jgi:asparagine synthase (glutamine-hydrolysing)